jgi:hypothetical protein
MSYRRCPDCGALAWPGWHIGHRHRPPCPYTDTDPATWPEEALT